MGTEAVANTNYLDTDNVGSSSASSANVTYPASNLYDTVHRSRVWRSAGYWNITSTNKTIVFRETALTDLTATITEDEYTTDATFLAAIKAALEVAGASTYTVARDAATNKIKITSNGAGGGGIFQLIWTDASSAGFAAISGFDTTSDDTGALTYIADNLRIHTSEWLKWDMGTAFNPQGFIAIGEQSSAIQLSSDAAIKLQGNETDAWSSPSYEETLTYDESAISTFSSTGLHTSALRYWRLYIEDTANANGYVELSAVFLGTMFMPTTAAVQFPLSGKYLDSSQTQYSMGGVGYSEIGVLAESLDLTWAYLTISEKEELEQIYKNYKTAKPLFISLDQDTAFSSSTGRYVRLVKFLNPPSYSLVKPGAFIVNTTFREEL